ncbi:MAG: vitamin K epoxide reductase family protein [Chthoniobacterales bacterium]
MDTDECPPGLTFNPSAFRERLPIFGLAVIGFAIACYLALYQVGIVANVWDPLFGDGSRKVLHSAISRMLPVRDAALGALGYLADIITCAIGGGARWRTMPWMVLLYGAIVTAVGATALVLAILQPVLVHDGCTLCLTSAAISLVIVWLARHEVFASLAQVRSR